MHRIDQIVLLARYNEWMNERICAAAATLPAPVLSHERGAFFGSIIGTLNHIVVGDTIWLKRFAAQPRGQAALEPVVALAMPVSLDQILFASLEALRAHRQWLDAIIVRWAGSLDEADLESVVRYANLKGVVSNKRFASLITHFFNHQTHHRGQLTALLHQMGAEVGVTDLLALIADEPA
ncbi:MAG: DinB family protein [Burkholderiaceae bacterium]|nr:DinB family protein [Burkholderiaceae bacterium]